MVRHSLGLKAPKGYGWLTNPKKAAYNRAYKRTTFDVFKVGKSKKGAKSTSVLGFLIIIGLLLIPILWPLVLICGVIFGLGFFVNSLISSKSHSASKLVGHESSTVLPALPQPLDTVTAKSETSAETFEAQVAGTVMEDWEHAASRLGINWDKGTCRAVMASIKYSVSVYRALNGIDTPMPLELHQKVVAQILNEKDLIAYVNKWHDGVVKRGTPIYRVRLTRNEYFERVQLLISSH